MAEWEVHWSPDARDDLRGIVEFIAARGDAVNAMRIFERLMARVESLAEMPERGRTVHELQLAVEPPLLEVVERPWRILYVCEHGRVLVVAVVDGRRDVAAALESRVGPRDPGAP